MKRIKKVLAFLLVFAMTLSLMPTSFAIGGNRYINAVDTDTGIVTRLYAEEYNSELYVDADVFCSIMGRQPRIDSNLMIFDMPGDNTTCLYIERDGSRYAELKELADAMRVRYQYVQGRSYLLYQNTYDSYMELISLCKEALYEKYSYDYHTCGNLKAYIRFATAMDMFRQLRTKALEKHIIYRDALIDSLSMSEDTAAVLSANRYTPNETFMQNFSDDDTLKAYYELMGYSNEESLVNALCGTVEIFSELLAEDDVRYLLVPEVANQEQSGFISGVGTVFSYINSYYNLMQASDLFVNGMYMSIVKADIDDIAGNVLAFEAANDLYNSHKDKVSALSSFGTQAASEILYNGLAEKALTFAVGGLNAFELKALFDGISAIGDTSGKYNAAVKWSAGRDLQSIARSTAKNAQAAANEDERFGEYDATIALKYSTIFCLKLMQYGFVAMNQQLDLNNVDSLVARLEDMICSIAVIDDSHLYRVDNEKIDVSTVEFKDVEEPSQESVTPAFGEPGEDIVLNPVGVLSSDGCGYSPYTTGGEWDWGSEIITISPLVLSADGSARFSFEFIPCEEYSRDIFGSYVTVSFDGKWHRAEDSGEIPVTLSYGSTFYSYYYPGDIILEGYLAMDSDDNTFHSKEVGGQDMLFLDQVVGCGVTQGPYGFSEDSVGVIIYDRVGEFFPDLALVYAP